MKLVKIGNKWINLDLMTDAFMNDRNEVSVFCGNSDDGQCIALRGNEAKALAQLLDNTCTKIMVEEDTPQ